jgi:hypothetical protein
VWKRFKLLFNAVYVSRPLFCLFVMLVSARQVLATNPL